MFNKLSLIMVTVSDMSQSVTFYRDVLGLPLEYETPYWSQFKLDGIVLGLHPQGDTLPVNPGGGIQFGFYVKEIQPILDALAAKGVQPARITDEPFGILALIKDPDGYDIQICQSRGAY